MPTAPSFRSGTIETFLLRDGHFTAPAETILHTSGEPDRARAIARWGRPQIATDVNCFFLSGPMGVTLIDAGVGTAWGEGFGHARAQLAALGIAPAAVERVLVTHLHDDHLNGLYDGDEPFFPEAEIWAPQADLAFFTDPEARARLPESRHGGFKVAEKLLRVFGDRVRALPAGAVLPGIEAVLLPGHTPGHTGYLIEGRLLVWADLLHLQSLQPAEPEIGLVFDIDPALAASTRRATLARAAAEGLVIAGSHVEGFHRVTASGAGFALE
ncbi:MBL fold metallo-hydrolase [Pseudoroseomonas deserti]|uniref:MBL fold metallo-hydrolase n=1 Tax=Teichococcus deserti TaxID=1817963 RepID=A0A1V2GVE7_9PROT|nr:MBL fold metallo-hydrolase [Pseudoroseomonas deserti]ONG45686.1 MBL fold metallo-hydrolase [Pseudoroseomonas deserti]